MNELMIKVRNKMQTELSRICNQSFEAILRKRLRVERFSIVCSNCIGGVIYNRLGKQFLSPTINLWMNQRDYLKFVLNLDMYLEQPLVFVDDHQSYPVAMLHDVKIHFNHSRNEDEAREDWMRRRTRVDRENLYLIMYDRDGITEEEIRCFGNIPCRNRLVLSTKEYPNFEYVVTIKPENRLFGEQYLDKGFLGIRTFEKKFDYVKWLNVGVENGRISQK